MKHLRDLLGGVNGWVEAGIVGSQRRDQLGHISAALDAMEAGLELVEGGANPSEDHRPAAPVLHAAGDPADAVVDVLDGVGRRERALEVLGEPELLGGEQLVEAFADRRSGTRMLVSETTRQRLEAAPRCLDRGRPKRVVQKT